MTTPVRGTTIYETLELTRQALAAEQARVEQLRQAMLSNRRIGTATGIVMITGDLDAEQAFEVLRRASMNLNRKLIEVAEDVICLRYLPAPPLRATPGHTRGHPGASASRDDLTANSHWTTAAVEISGQ